MSNHSYNADMPTRRANTFEDFYGELEAEARAEGPEAIRDLRAKEIKYALINTLIIRRRDLHLTQQALAEQAGVAQTEISKIERGRKSPTLDTFSRIASALRLEFSPQDNAPRVALAARRLGTGIALAWRVEQGERPKLTANRVSPKRSMGAVAMTASRTSTRGASRTNAKKSVTGGARQRKNRSKVS